MRREEIYRLITEKLDDVKDFLESYAVATTFSVNEYLNTSEQLLSMENIEDPFFDPIREERIKTELDKLYDEEEREEKEEDINDKWYGYDTENMLNELTIKELYDYLEYLSNLKNHYIQIIEAEDKCFYDKEKNFVTLKDNFKEYLDEKGFKSSEFYELQLRELWLGVARGVDASIYANPEYDEEQMRHIREGLEKGLDVSIYADPKFNDEQMGRIRWGLEKDLDVSIYADSKYNWRQMEEISFGLKAGVDISIYADTKYDYWQMQEIREGLEAGLDTSIYAEPKYTGSQMREIRMGLIKERQQGR